MFMSKVTVEGETGLAIEAETTVEARIMQEVFGDLDKGTVTCHKSNQHRFPILILRKEVS